MPQTNLLDEAAGGGIRALVFDSAFESPVTTQLYGAITRSNMWLFRAFASQNSTSRSRHDGFYVVSNALVDTTNDLHVHTALERDLVRP